MAPASQEDHGSQVRSIFETYAMVTTVSGPLVETSRAFRAAASWAMMVVLVARAVWIAENTARVPRPGMPAVHHIGALHSFKDDLEKDQGRDIASHDLGVLKGQLVPAVDMAVTMMRSWRYCINNMVCLPVCSM